MTWQLIGNIAGKTPRDGKDGASVDPAVVEMMVMKAVAAMPVPRDGKDGKDGRDGASVDPAVVEMMIAKAVAALPPPRDGEDGRDGTVDLAAVELMVSKAVAALPMPKDGKDGASVGLADVEPVIATHVDRALAARPLPKDGANGIGIASAVVDRAGHLVLMLTDGTTKDVGPVVGRDGDADEMRAIVAESVQKAIEAIPIPKDGKDGKDGRDGVDGLGFDDLDVVFDETRGHVLQWARDGRTREKPLATPWDARVWVVGRMYPRGAGVTWGGAWWIAQVDTRNKPGESPDWRLAVKAGKDGKPGPPGPRGDDDA